MRGREQDRNIRHHQCKVGQPGFIESLMCAGLWNSWEGSGLKKPPLESRKQLSGEKTNVQIQGYNRVCEVVRTVARSECDNYKAGKPASDLRPITASWGIRGTFPASVIQCLTLLCPVGILSEHSVEHSEDEALDEFGAVPAQNRWAALALLMVTHRRQSYKPRQEVSGKSLLSEGQRDRTQQAAEEGRALEAEGRD